MTVICPREARAINPMRDVPYMGHRAQDGKKVDEMSLFKKKYEAGTDR